MSLALGTRRGGRRRHLSRHRRPGVPARRPGCSDERPRQLLRRRRPAQQPSRRRRAFLRRQSRHQHHHQGRHARRLRLEESSSSPNDDAAQTITGASYTGFMSDNGADGQAQTLNGGARNDVVISSTAMTSSMAASTPTPPSPPPQRAQDIQVRREQERLFPRRSDLRFGHHATALRRCQQTSISLQTLRARRCDRNSMGMTSAQIASASDRSLWKRTGR